MSLPCSSLDRWKSHADPVDCLFCATRSTPSGESNKGYSSRQQRTREWGGEGGDGRDDSGSGSINFEVPCSRGILVERRKASWEGGFLEERGRSALFLFGTPLSSRSAGGQRAGMGTTAMGGGFGDGGWGMGAWGMGWMRTTVCVRHCQKAFAQTRGSKRCFGGWGGVAWCGVVGVNTFVTSYAANWLDGSKALVEERKGRRRTRRTRRAWQRWLKGPFFCTPATAHPSDLSGLALSLP